jgi:hypothetical protein
MRKSLFLINIKLIFILILISITLTDCLKSPDPVQYPYGHFPDSVVNLDGINSAYDDYNSSGYQINGVLPLIFSSNRKSAGEQFDLEQGVINFTWDQQVGTFLLNSMMTTDLFYAALIKKCETPLNDFGPYRTYSSYDGYEYMILASQTANGDLDLKYCKNLPYYYGTIPEITGPNPVTLLNTTFDDAYLTFDLNLDTAYYISNPEGNFDIYFKTRPDGKDIGEWFSQGFSASEKVDSINSPYDDKCPMVYNKFMVFTSNRPEGFGGYDLYYSQFKNGKWNAPVNFGPKINSAKDEYRPLIGYFPDFKNIYMIFSSNRPGGKGGFDLYFTGVNIPQ